MDEPGPALTVIQAGAWSTVQDRGRPGFRGLGVPVGGAFDLDSQSISNAMLGNDPGAATVELTALGGVYRAERRLALALAGAPFRARIVRVGGPRGLAIPQTFALEAGDLLEITGTPLGWRAYLAVKGGWRSGVTLGSRSTEVRLEPGDVLLALDGSCEVRRPALAGFPDPRAAPIRLIDGPDGPAPARLFANPFRVGVQSDRVGIRLEGGRLDGLAMPGRASSPVDVGAVQVAGGSPIILGVAGGTMGGYPHVAHVVAADLDRLGQARPGDPLRFVRIGREEAVELDRLRRLGRAQRDLRIGLSARGGRVD